MSETGMLVQPRLDLPSGGWVEFKDPHDVRAKEKRRVMRSLTDPERAAVFAMDVTEGIAAMLIVRWEIPDCPNLPIPLDDLNMLDMLSIADYDAIIDATRPVIKLFFPDSTPDDAGKPGTPTLPASD
jgi:hypothetical protein